MEKGENDNVGCKIDHMNEAIYKLLNDPNVSRNEQFSLISPINSFSESFLDFDIKVGENLGVLDRVQELLTEIDRLNMKIEDLNVQITRIRDPSFEMNFSRENLENLQIDIEKFLKDKPDSVFIKLTKDSFLIESENKQEKVIYFPGEVRSTYFNHEDKNDLGIQLIKKKAELDAKIVNLSKRQQKTQELEEQLAEKIESLEMLKLQYMNKVNEKPQYLTVTPAKSKRTCSCSDQTDYSFLTDTGSYQNISSLASEKAKMTNHCSVEDSLSKDATVQYSQKKRFFIDSLSRFSNKEPQVIAYFKDLSQFYDEKFLELVEYEKYLQETWIDTCGNPNAVIALHKASQKNFEVSKSLKKQREIIEEKTMRLEKIKNIVEEESKKLGFHRKKILLERQVLIQQQSDLEQAYQRILSLH